MLVCTERARDRNGDRAGMHICVSTHFPMTRELKSIKLRQNEYFAGSCCKNVCTFSVVLNFTNYENANWCLISPAKVSLSKQTIYSSVGNHEPLTSLVKGRQLTEFQHNSPVFTLTGGHGSYC